MINVSEEEGKTVQDWIDLAAKLVVEFSETGEEFVLRDTLQGPEKEHKIYEIFHLMEAVNGMLFVRDLKIDSLNEKIKEMGIELSQLKRQKK